MLKLNKIKLTDDEMKNDDDDNININRNINRVKEQLGNCNILEETLFDLKW